MSSTDRLSRYRSRVGISTAPPTRMYRGARAFLVVSIVVCLLGGILLVRLQSYVEHVGRLPARLRQQPRLEWRVGRVKEFGIPFAAVMLFGGACNSFICACVMVAAQRRGRQRFAKEEERKKTLATPRDRRVARQLTELANSIHPPVVDSANVEQGGAPGTSPEATHVTEPQSVCISEDIAGPPVGMGRRAQQLRCIAAGAVLILFAGMFAAFEVIAINSMVLRHPAVGAIQSFAMAVLFLGVPATFITPPPLRLLYLSRFGVGASVLAMLCVFVLSGAAAEAADTGENAATVATEALLAITLTQLAGTTAFAIYLHSRSVNTKDRPAPGRTILSDEQFAEMEEQLRQLAADDDNTNRSS